MSDVIRLLPDSVANQIAAGEVIQRPASVIKELVENAVDAGATDIRINVKDAGKTLIQIIDNGCGMSETDARMAFERHATSKIRRADDLFTLQTMGFRGEALPSICAISEVEVRTRTTDAPIGTRLVIVGSKVETQEPCVCDKGTCISVRKLFFNVPARRKFLKSDNVELSNIMREFERLALVNNQIRLSIDNGTRLIDLRAALFRLRIEDIWKNNLKSEQLLPVEVDTSLVRIEGFVSRPEFARRRNPLQFLIVNGRNMRHPYFHKAVLSCYDSLIATDTQPCYFLKFTVDPSSIDVNIHPTKNEIKFEYEQQIWPILVSAVKTSLGKYSAVPSIDFTVDAIPLNPLLSGEQPRVPDSGFHDGYNPFKASSRQTRVNPDWESLYEGVSADFGNAESETRENANPFCSLSADTAVERVDGMFGEVGSAGEVAQMCIQFANKYIVTSTRGGLLVIDQHRAHLRILYDGYMREVEKMDVVSQSVMFPERVTLDQGQQAALDEVSGDLHRMGFGLEYESGSDWRITAVPAMLRKSDPKDVILRILDSVQEDSVNYGKDGAGDFSIQQRVALMMARSASIRRGVRLSADEMEHIISSLFSLPDPSLTPGGNPIFLTLDEKRISSMLTI